MAAKRVQVLLPTLNERENVEPMIEGLFALGVKGLEVVVVDDGSEDGTDAEVRRLGRRHPGLRLIERQGPRGRGRAGREGFLYSLADGADIIVEMDADLSHEPRFLPRLLEALERCDVAIGSRRAPGGSDRQRPLLRRALTGLANAYARGLLGLPVLDTNSGFRAYRREALAAIDPAALKSAGPSIVHEVLFRAVQAGLRVREVPIEFAERKAGRSKLTLGRLAAGYLWIGRLRLIG